MNIVNLKRKRQKLLLNSNYQDNKDYQIKTYINDCNIALSKKLSRNDIRIYNKLNDLVSQIQEKAFVRDLYKNEIIFYQNKIEYLLINDSVDFIAKYAYYFVLCNIVLTKYKIYNTNNNDETYFNSLNNANDVNIDDDKLILSILNLINIDKLDQCEDILLAITLHIKYTNNKSVLIALINTFYRADFTFSLTMRQSLTKEILFGRFGEDIEVIKNLCTILYKIDLIDLKSQSYLAASIFHGRFGIADEALEKLAINLYNFKFAQSTTLVYLTKSIF